MANRGAALTRAPRSHSRSGPALPQPRQPGTAQRARAKSTETRAAARAPNKPLGTAPAAPTSAASPQPTGSAQPETSPPAGLGEAQEKTAAPSSRPHNGAARGTARPRFRTASRRRRHFPDAGGGGKRACAAQGAMGTVVRGGRGQGTA